jgi:hypothetical protein
MDLPGLDLNFGNVRILADCFYISKHFVRGKQQTSRFSPISLTSKLALPTIL